MNGMSKKDNDRDNSARDDDSRYVVLCQGGDTNAFQVLVERHQKKMLNIAHRFIGDYGEACETVQEAFFSAFKAIKNFRGDATFSTWLTGITINHARNRLKGMRTRLHHEGLSIDNPVVTETGQILADNPSQEASIIEQLEKKEVQARVQACINTLDDEFREVLVLRDLQEFSYDEIHDILNIPEGTIKSRLFRARQAMEICLKKTLGDFS
jgi:RNA polymerase sigma-70 factor (ECF subfamily)